MKNSVFPVVLILTASATISAQDLTQDPKTVQEIEAIEREVTDALARRDRTALEKLLAEGFTFIHASGQRDSRKQYLDLAASGGLTRQQVEVERINEPIRLYDGNAAIRISRTIFRFKQENRESQLRNTVVYVKLAGRWKLATSQSTRLPDRPKAVQIDKRIYGALIGLYEISATRNLTIRKMGDTLVGEVPLRPPFELIPESNTEFVRYSEEGGYGGDDKLVFIKDATGAVTHAALQYEGQELWRARKVN